MLNFKLHLFGHAESVVIGKVTKRRSVVSDSYDCRILTTADGKVLGLNVHGRRGTGFVCSDRRRTFYDGNNVRLSHRSLGLGHLSIDGDTDRVVVDHPFSGRFFLDFFYFFFLQVSIPGSNTSIRRIGNNLMDGIV